MGAPRRLRPRGNRQRRRASQNTKKFAPPHVSTQSTMYGILSAQTTT